MEKLEFGKKKADMMWKESNVGALMRKGGEFHQPSNFEVRGDLFTHR